MGNKVRLNTTVSKDHYDRLHALTDRVPGLTISGLFGEILADALPMLEAMLDKADELPDFKHDEQAQDNYMMELVARQVIEKMFANSEQVMHAMAHLGGKKSGS